MAGGLGRRRWGVPANSMGSVGEMGHLVEGRGGWLGIVVSTNKSRVVINHDFSLRLGDFRQNLGKN